MPIFSGIWFKHNNILIVHLDVFSSQVLNRCYQEFGLLVPNYQLNQLNTIKDVIKFFTSAQPKDTRTFQSIDINNLPPNLNIGGKVPWKSISS